MARETSSVSSTLSPADGSWLYPLLMAAALSVLGLSMLGLAVLSGLIT